MSPLYRAREETAPRSYFLTNSQFPLSGVTTILKSSVLSAASLPKAAPNFSTTARPAEFTAPVVATHRTIHDTQSSQLGVVGWLYSRAQPIGQIYLPGSAQACRSDTISIPHSTRSPLPRDGGYNPAERPERPFADLILHILHGSPTSQQMGRNRRGSSFVRTYRSVTVVSTL